MSTLPANPFGLEFHHLGLAVREPAAAYAFLRGLGYSLGEPIFDPLQKVNLALCAHPAMPQVEVIWPGPERSPVDKLVSEREGLVYHTCFVALDVERSLQLMKGDGLKVIPIGPAQPAVLFGGTSVSFHVVMGMGLIEIIHGRPG